MPELSQTSTPKEWQVLSIELALAASQVYMIRKQRHFSNPGTLRIGYGVPHDDFNHYTTWHVQEN